MPTTQSNLKKDKPTDTVVEDIYWLMGLGLKAWIQPLW